MAFNREAALAEGYTEDEINAYLQAEAAKNKATPVTADPGEPPAPQTKINNVGSSAEAVATTGGLAVAPYVVPAAGAAAAAVGGKKLYGAWNASAEAAKALADAKMASEQGIANRAQQRMSGNMRPVTGPVAPQGTPTYNVPTANTPQMRAPVPTAPVAPQGMPAPTGPVAPQGMPAQAARQTPGIMAQIRALAANKVLPAVGGMAKGSVGPGMAMYSPELGPKTPQTGRMRGMEINPLTGRPWTPEQIKQYESNPTQFDSQMAPPQMRR